MGEVNLGAINLAANVPLEQAITRMQGSRVYFDTNIFIYVLDNIIGLADVCVPFFKAIEAHDIFGCSGDMAIAELLVKPMQTDDRVNIERIHALFDNELGYFEAIPHPRETLVLAAQLRATQRLKMIDAIHAATAIKGGCKYFVTHDAGLAKNFQGLEVVDIKAFL